MKKIIALFLVLLVLLSLCSCAKTEEVPAKAETYSEYIPIGDGVEDYALTGNCYGTYTVTEPLADPGEGVEVVTYCCEDSDTPYIEVYRQKKDGRTLEEFTKEESEKWGNGSYLMINEKNGQYTCSSDSDKGYFYVSCLTYEGEENYITLCFSCRTEEVALGDSGMYLWVPTGYISNLDDESVSHDVFFRGHYESEYFLPGIWVSKDFTVSYEEFCWYWGQDWDEMPVTKETYDLWAESDWDVSPEEYYGAFGITDLTCREGEQSGCRTFVATGDYDGRMDDIYINVGGMDYNIFLYFAMNPAPDYSDVIINSLHGEIKESEGMSFIPIGGLIPDYDATGPAYGKYVEVDLLPELQSWVEEGDEYHCYYSEGSDTPYIVVWRWKNTEGQTLEERAEKIIEENGAAAYQVFEYEGLKMATYQSSITLNDGKYYYRDNTLMLDGDEFVVVNFIMNCEEVQLGDSGQYIWVPTGYTDLMNDDELAHGTSFMCKYDENYYLPTIWVGNDSSDLEELKWYWSDYFDELPFDEETFNSWEESGWDEKACKAYYESFGYSDDYMHFTGEHNGLKTSSYVCSSESETMFDLYVYVGDDCYNIVLMDHNENPSIFSKVLLESLHTK